MDGLQALPLINSLYLKAEQPYFLIAIAGGTCSGKTFFTNRLVSYFHPSKVTVIVLDNYFKDKDDPTLPRDEKGRLLFDTPNSYHHQDFTRDVQTLLSGYPVYQPAYNLSDNHRTSDKGELSVPKPIIVAEGLFVISYLIHLKPLSIYMEASSEIRCKRRIVRDSAMLGIPPDIIEQIFFSRFQPLHDQFVNPQSVLAQIIIKT
jgi:uridine kinase